MCKDKNISFHGNISSWILWKYQEIWMKILIKNIGGIEIDQNL